MRRLRAVSEIVSVLLLIMIVTTVGFAIYAAFMSQLNQMSRTAERLVAEAEKAAYTRAVIAAGYVEVNTSVPCGDLHLFLVASGSPLDVEGVYIDDIPVYPPVGSSLASCISNTTPPTITLYPGIINYTRLPLTLEVLNHILTLHPREVTVKIVTKYNVDVRVLEVSYLT